MPGAALGLAGSAVKIGSGLAGGSQAAGGYDAAAESRARIGEYNYAASERNARLSEMLGLEGIEATTEAQEAQAELMRQGADVEFWEAKVQKDIHQWNAKRIKKYGKIESKLAWENIRRTEANFEKQKKVQRAAYAAAGVVMETGSPLMVAEETAKNMQMASNDMNYQRILALSQRQEAAAFERFTGYVGMISARNRRSLAYAEADLVVQDTSMQEAAVGLQYDQAMVQANIARMANDSQIAGYRSQASASRTSAAGNAISGGIGAVGNLLF